MPFRKPESVMLYAYGERSQYISYECYLNTLNEKERKPREIIAKSHTIRNLNLCYADVTICNILFRENNRRTVQQGTETGFQTFCQGLTGGLFVPFFKETGFRIRGNEQRTGDDVRVICG